MATKFEEYKFPHEQDEKEDELNVVIEDDDDTELKVEVVDDTPPEDRHVEPLPEDIKTELEKVDESEDYSHNVKIKFKQYKKAWHDERRAKEAAFREQQEALAVAQRILDENKKLKSMIQTGEKELISTYQTSAEMELDKAERNYKEAYDSGDSEKLLAAQKELVRAEMKLDKAKNFKPTVQIDENNVQTTPQRPAAEPQMDPKVANWVSRNPWFVDQSKVAMRKYAEGVHEELAVRYGRGFIGTDEYYASIDKEVKRRFPEEFAPSANDEEKPQRTKPATVVAPAKRSTAPKQVVLTKTQEALAKKLGLTKEQYAREKMKLEA